MSEGTEPARHRAGDKDLGPPPQGMYRLGMFLFLVVLTMIFIATIIGHLVVSSRAEQWPPAGSPPLPRGLWLSTLFLIVLSIAAEWAVHAIRAGRAGRMKALLIVSSLAALGFVAMQFANWRSLANAMPETISSLYEFTFFLLTGLHAAHIVGGLGFLAVVLVRGMRGYYDQQYNVGVRMLAVYWHYLGGVWIVLFGVLLATS